MLYPPLEELLLEMMQKESFLIWTCSCKKKNFVEIFVMKKIYFQIDLI